MDEKILDGPAAGYCSSSEDEEAPVSAVKDEDEHQARVMRRMGGGTSNTGAKGVLADFREFQESVAKSRDMDRNKMIQRARRGNFELSKDEREKAAAEDSDKDEIESLERIRARRQEQLYKIMRGRIIEITKPAQYLELTDSPESNLVVILLYSFEDADCEHLTDVLKVLTLEYPAVKFARGTANILGLSQRFLDNAIPTLQVFDRGLLVGNFVRLATYLPDDYSPSNLVDFLLKKYISLSENRFLGHEPRETDKSDESEGEDADKSAESE